MAYTVSETLPMFKKADLLNPVPPRTHIMADFYLGEEYNSSSPDVYIFRKDHRFLCVVEPGLLVFLSDDVTHHYASVENVDYEKQIITLADPWASESFLLAGYNVIDVKARAYIGLKGQPLLDLSFDEFLRALRGSIEMDVPQALFQVLEKIYPVETSEEAYLVWKYSRLLASDYPTQLIIRLEMSKRSDLSSKPRLSLLIQYANDLVAGVPTDFGIAQGGPVKEAEGRELRKAFLERLDDMPKHCPGR